MILTNGQIKTPNISYCKYNSDTHKYDITFTNGKTYHYNYNKVQWLQNPQYLNPENYKIYHQGKALFNIQSIYVFSSPRENYWHIVFTDNSVKDYFQSNLQISESCLTEKQSENVFQYLNHIVCAVGLKSDEGENLLYNQYKKLTYIEKSSALACYLNPQAHKIKKRSSVTPIFPFGCNASQYAAVKAALENSISVIEGPPGTGKTQTILNILANLLIADKTVQVVSNNNSATLNILEKLSSPKYGMDFLVAALGNQQNKESFLENQSGTYPDISAWEDNSIDKESLESKLQEQSIKLKDIFKKQEHLALTKQELAALETEQKYFEQYCKETDVSIENIKLRKSISSQKIIKLWQQCQFLADSGKKASILVRLKASLVYGILDWHFFDQDISKPLTAFQGLYYKLKRRELLEKIESLNSELSEMNASEYMKDFTKNSMHYLKSVLFSKYGQKLSRKKFCIDDFYKNTAEFQQEYPIVLSSTFSSRSSVSTNASFDYLIMDEASQVDVATGALALSSAKNAVIVGDRKQLPNIVNKEHKAVANEIFKHYSIDKGYNYTQNSFLKSICEIIPNIEQTLLKEHYRCHPKIIDFCNQKFYDGELIIMTEDSGETNVLQVIKTVIGNHQRGKMNQRQIDVIQKEVLPELSYEPQDIGIIAPYNDQVHALIKAVDNPKIETATVHKFQGREKSSICLTTVDDEITDFTDDPYLLNVAVSRAKEQFTLVISGNDQPLDSNISDLVSYIEYNNFSVTESEIYSVFDYLYTQYTESRLAYLRKHKKISAYDSENLMYALICDILNEKNYTELKTACHFPLNMLIRDPKFLDEKQCDYAMNPATHVDFLIYNRISKKPILAIEVDGYYYHKEGSAQAERDKMKNTILDLYKIPYLRFATNGSSEKEKLTEKLGEIF